MPSKVPVSAADESSEEKFSMVSPAHHPVTPNQTENVFDQAPVKAAQKPPAKPQPVQDSVTLSRSGDVDHDGDSK